MQLSIKDNIERSDLILPMELSIAKGEQPADLVLKNAGYINVFTETVEYADIAICNNKIVGIGQYEGKEEIDCTHKIVCPGFIDGHIHLESSMMKPVEFAKVVLSHGTTAVITDPHEIANVCGKDGITYMLHVTQDIPVDVYFTLPSCVPATSFDESGGTLKAKDLEEFYEHDRVIGLAEVMDYTGIIQGNEDLLEKIKGARSRNKVVDGHAPGLLGKDACAYILAGIGSDHECVNLEEAKQKLSLGQWIMIREGTAAKNLNALLELFEPPYHQRAMLVSDDKNPYELKKYGHIDEMLRSAIRQGADPCRSIKMATFNPASYFGLKNLGAIAPGYYADMVLLSDLSNIKIEKVIKKGKIVVDGSDIIDMKESIIDANIRSKVYNSVHCKELTPEDFAIRQKMSESIKEDLCKTDDTEEVTSHFSNINSEAHRMEKRAYYRVIEFIPGEIVTKETKMALNGGIPLVSIENDILKIAAIERHRNTGHIGLGFAHGYGLKQGAIASSVAHDSHNIIVIGTNDIDMAIAANCIRMMQGGWVIVVDGKIVDKLPLPIAGLMSELSVEELAEKIKNFKIVTSNLGVKKGIDPFMTLGFVSLPVIPELRLITTGLFDVKKQRMVPLMGS